MRLDSNVYLLVEVKTNSIVLMGGSLIAMLRSMDLVKDREDILESIQAGYPVKHKGMDLEFRRMKLGKVARQHADKLGFKLV